MPRCLPRPLPCGHAARKLCGGGGSIPVSIEIGAMELAPFAQPAIWPPAAPALQVETPGQGDDLGDESPEIGPGFVGSLDVMSMPVLSHTRPTAPPPLIRRAIERLRLNGHRRDDLSLEQCSEQGGFLLANAFHIGRQMHPGRGADTQAVTLTREVNAGHRQLDAERGGVRTISSSPPPCGGWRSAPLRQSSLEMTEVERCSPLKVRR